MSLRKKQRVVVLLSGVLVALFLGLAGMIFLGKNPVDKLEIQDVHVDSQATISLNGMEQISQKDGITKWELSARSASLIQKENKAVLQEIRVTFYTSDQQKVILTADQGQLNTRTHDIFLEKNVVVTYETARAKTHSLHYEKKNHIIWSDSEVQLTDGDSLIRADSMTIALTDNKLIFSGHVKGRLYEQISNP